VRPPWPRPAPLAPPAPPARCVASLSATYFDTEDSYDNLIVNGVAYSGTIGPSGVSLTSDDLWWYLDNQFGGTGWEVCAHVSPPTSFLKHF
jgi:hypothetical protein